MALAVNLSTATMMRTFIFPLQFVNEKNKLQDEKSSTLRGISLYLFTTG